MWRILTPFIFLLCVQSAGAGIINGTIRDASTDEPVGFATVAAVGTSYSVSANAEGQYRLRLPAGSYELKFSHVAHYSETMAVTTGDSAVQQDVYLQPAIVEVGSINVYDRHYDAAQRIIIEAIKRKDELLSHIQQYSFDAYTKASARDTSKADSSSYFAILESQVTAYWKYPDDQKEIITGRRQSANLKAEWNLISVGALLNFNRNRIDLDRYAVVSPTATDALDYYEYYLIDTTYLDGRTVFVLEIEPKNRIDPLFVGTIKIADSSYAVVGVDVGFNEGFDNTITSNARYRQIFSEFDSQYWMPVLIQYSAIIDFKFPGVPVLAVDYQAALHNYDFSVGIQDTVFGEYVLEVDKGADDVDSIQWTENRLMPLTPLEERGYIYRDSLVNHKPLLKKISKIPLAGLGLLVGAPDIFHFNRVEGPYLGLGYYFENLGDRWSARAKTGYAFDAELWQHDYYAWYMLHPGQRIWFGLGYHDEVRTSRTIFARPNGNATFMAIMGKVDAYDYYREKGFFISATTKLLNKTRLNVGYNDLRHSSLAVNSDFSFFDKDEAPRPNPAITDGKLRSLDATFTFDSRQLFKDKGRDRRLFSFPFTIFRAGVEHASDDLFENDFDFTRYYASLRDARRMFGWGISRLYIYAGASDRNLPPQKYFVADFDAGLTESSLSFHTMGQKNFVGSRVFAAHTELDFERKLFRKSGLPLIKDIPFTLELYGGIFWTDFKGHPNPPTGEDIRIATTPYCEIGFEVGRIIPYGLFSEIGLDFTWQRSKYDTNDFTFGVSFDIFGL